MRTFYRGKRDELLKAIKESDLREKVSVLQADAGLHFLLQVKTGMSDEELVRRAEEKGVRLACLSQYFHERRSGGTETHNSIKNIWETADNERKEQHLVIINYSGLDQYQIKRLAKVLNEAWFEEVIAGKDSGKVL